MDLERAQQLINQAQIVDHVKTLEPVVPAENLSPRERFDAIGGRIENLEAHPEDALGIYTTVSFRTGEHTLRLQLGSNYSTYTDENGKQRELYGVGAKWFVNDNVLAYERITVEELKEPDASRILGQIEESVTEVEKARAIESSK